MLISQNLNVFVASNLKEEKEEKKAAKIKNEQGDVEYEFVGERCVLPFCCVI